MKALNIKPTHKVVKEYYEEISNLSGLGVHHEGAVSPAFASLLRACAHQYDKTLIEKQAMKADRGTIFIDGAIYQLWLLDNPELTGRQSSPSLNLLVNPEPVM